MNNGNHMIIRNHRISGISWNEQEDELTSWFNALPERFREGYIIPVASGFGANTFTTGMGSFTREANNFLIANLASNSTVANDRTVFAPNGAHRVFALSLADVDHLSRTDGFRNPGERVALDDEVAVGHWWLRTPESATNAWIVAGASALGWGNLTFDFVSWGVRPALIIYQ